MGALGLKGYIAVLLIKQLSVFRRQEKTIKWMLVTVMLIKVDGS